MMIAMKWIAAHISMPRFNIIDLLQIFATIGMWKGGYGWPIIIIWFIGMSIISGTLQDSFHPKVRRGGGQI